MHGPPDPHTVRNTNTRIGSLGLEALRNPIQVCEVGDVRTFSQALRLTLYVPHGKKSTSFKVASK